MIFPADGRERLGDETTLWMPVRKSAEEDGEQRPFAPFSLHLRSGL
jgi:hypothetical protein